jgi:hypothetical protein
MAAPEASGKGRHARAVTMAAPASRRRCLPLAAPFRTLEAPPRMGGRTVTHFRKYGGPPEAAATDPEAMIVPGPTVSQWPARRGSPLRLALLKVLVHGGFLVIALGCFVAYGHFHSQHQSGPALTSLVAAAAFALIPVRDVVRMAFAVEGHALHVVHILGGLGLVALPLAGVVSSGPVLTRAAMAPFAIMGAAQAVMHQNHPRNAKQAAAMRRFAASLPEVAQFAGSKNLATPANAVRAVAVLSDILGKAQALGETELQADPAFQNALRQASTRLGASLGLDAVDLVLSRLAANPATAAAVPALRQRLALARRTITAGTSR